MFAGLQAQAHLISSQFFIFDFSELAIQQIQ